MKRSALIGGGVAIAAATSAVWTGVSLLPGVRAQITPVSATRLFGAGAAGVTVTPAMREAASMQSAFNEVAHQAAPAVVTITTVEKIPATRGGGRGGDPFGGMLRQFGVPDGGMGEEDGSGGGLPGGGMGGGGRREGLGSGFIVRNDGLILTNAHVVRGADTVTVKLSDGREFKNAKVLGSDDESDVAVVKIPAANLPIVPLADSDDVNVGDWAIALGNPFGLDHTVTVGVISAKGREVPNSESKSSGEFLQTDASINPGNSGGPLLDIYGRVVGINNSIYSQSGGSVGIGFAVPIDTAKTIANQLVTSGKVRRARLNVGISDAAGQGAAYGLDPATKGVIIGEVFPGGAGARAGLQPGDVVTVVNGKPVLKMHDLITAVSNTPAGGSVTLDVLRGGVHKTITAQPEEIKSGVTTTKSADTGDTPSAATGTLGISYRALTAELAQEMGVDPATHGLVVTGVRQGSPAQAAGIVRGDIIVRVGQTLVNSSDDINRAVKGILSREAEGDKSVALYVSHASGQGHRIESYTVVAP